MAVGGVRGQGKLFLVELIRQVCLEVYHLLTVDLNKAVPYPVELHELPYDERPTWLSPTLLFIKVGREFGSDLVDEAVEVVIGFVVG